MGNYILTVLGFLFNPLGFTPTETWFDWQHHMENPIINFFSFYIVALSQCKMYWFSKSEKQWTFVIFYILAFKGFFALNLYKNIVILRLLSKLISSEKNTGWFLNGATFQNVVEPIKSKYPLELTSQHVCIWLKRYPIKFRFNGVLMLSTEIRVAFILITDSLGSFRLFWAGY